MTDTATETVAEETVSTDETPQFDVSTLDEFGQEFVTKTTAYINALNAKKVERKAKSTNPHEIAEAIYEGLMAGNAVEGVEISDKVLEQYNKAQEIVEKAMAHFRAVAEETGKQRAAQATNADEVAALDTEIEALEKKVKRARDMLALEYPGAENALPDVVRGRTSSGGGSGKGSGGRKLRGFTVTVDGTVAVLSNAEGKKVSSFSAGAKQLGIPTADLQRAYMAAAGTEDAEKFPDSQDLTVKGADEKEHAVNITRNKE